MNNAEFAHTLRGLADLYANHDDLPQCFSDRLYVYVSTKEALAASVRILGPGKKNSVNDCLNYRPDNWPLDLWASKSSMGCEVIEEKIEVPEQVIPARAEQVIPAHTEIRKTYKCEPFLKLPEDTTPKLLEAPMSGANFGGPGE